MTVAGSGTCQCWARNAVAVDGIGEAGSLTPRARRYRRWQSALSSRGRPQPRTRLENTCFCSPKIAKKNADSAFALVEKIAKAQNFQEILTLQTQFAQDQMKAFTTQTQELYKLIGETVQKLQHS